MVFLNIFDCAWKPGFLKSSHIYCWFTYITINVCLSKGLCNNIIMYLIIWEDLVTNENKKTLVKTIWQCWSLIKLLLSSFWLSNNQMLTLCFLNGLWYRLSYQEQFMCKMVMSSHNPRLSWNWVSCCFAIFVGS